MAYMLSIILLHLFIPSVYLILTNSIHHCTHMFVASLLTYIDDGPIFENFYSILLSILIVLDCYGFKFIFLIHKYLLLYILPKYCFSLCPKDLQYLEVQQNFFFYHFGGNPIFSWSSSGFIQCLSELRYTAQR